MTGLGRCLAMTGGVGGLAMTGLGRVARHGNDVRCYLICFDMPNTNNLLHSSSPYLRKYAYSPIAWYPWCEEALALAAQENKPIVLSIGYAACHWCEVMGRETFEDAEVAALMNQSFIAIKVDREARPDIDRVYMHALQVMGLPTGWPLHVFLLPNQQPFYGGTYFTNAAWRQLLRQIARAYQHHRSQLESSATAFTHALQDIANVPCRHNPPSATVALQDLQHFFHNLSQHLDLTYGGIAGAPKFPMPSVSLFLHTYYLLTGHEDALAQLQRTLTAMACAGIYDQLAGGFARYATDAAWHMPHFEKMLYDNALLISLYAKGYACTQAPLYKEVVAQTMAFVVRAMQHPEGGFYSAVAADSEGEEGRFYTWTRQEVITALGDDYFSFVAHYPMIRCEALEKDRYLFTRDSAAALPSIEQAKQTLLRVRSQRVQPEVDTKVLTAGNVMMLQALLDAYYALGEGQYWDLAYSNARFIKQYLLQGDTVAHGYYQGEILGNGYLEDYAWVVRAWISLYQMTLEEAWLWQAVALTENALTSFGDSSSPLLHMSASTSNALLINPIEVLDEATLSPNAVMAHNLLQLGALCQREDYDARAQDMVASGYPLFEDNPVYIASWAHVYALQLHRVTVAITGSQCKEWAYEIKKQYPDVIVAGAIATSDLPLLQGKATGSVQGTSAYICHHRTCLSPVHSLADSLMTLRTIYAGAAPQKVIERSCRRRSTL